MKRLCSLGSIVFILGLAGAVVADDWNAVSLSDSVLSFGAVTAGETCTLSVTLTNNLTVPVEITGVDFEEGVFSTDLTMMPIPALGGHEFDVYFESEQNVDYADVLRITLDQGLRALVVAVSAEVHYSEPYYSSTRNKWAEELKDSLTDIIDGHTSLGYTLARDQMYGNIDNDSGWVECVYTGRTAFFNTRAGATANNFNCEHTWPQSFSAEAEPMRSDIFHLYPTDITANSMRGSYDFGIVTSPTWGQGGSKLGTDSEGQTVFEPRDVHKGNVARTHFYYIIRYNGAYNGYVDATKMEAHMRAWHIADPVDADEEARNEDIYALQNNRNPFIDHPALMDRISSFFGTATYEVAPEIAVAPAGVDLGTIGYDTTAYYHIAIINSGNDTLHVSSITSTDPDFGVGTSSLVLAPDSYGYVWVSYASAEADVSDSTSVIIASDDGDENSIEVPVIVEVLDAAGLDHPGVVPAAFGLAQNFPNPFVSQTVISFEIDASAAVDLSIHNVRGQLIDRPLAGKSLTSGSHRVVFAGRDLAPGIYYYRLTAGDRVQTKRMVLLGP
ncbi:MAG: endonuclease [Candidatus Eisenbacteria bacterium]